MAGYPLLLELPFDIDDTVEAKTELWYDFVSPPQRYLDINMRAHRMEIRDVVVGTSQPTSETPFPALRALPPAIPQGGGSDSVPRQGFEKPNPENSGIPTPTNPEHGVAPKRDPRSSETSSRSKASMVIGKTGQPLANLSVQLTSTHYDKEYHYTMDYSIENLVENGKTILPKLTLIPSGTVLTSVIQTASQDGAVVLDTPGRSIEFVKSSPSSNQMMLLDQFAVMLDDEVVGSFPVTYYGPSREGGDTLQPRNDPLVAQTPAQARSFGIQPAEIRASKMIGGAVYDMQNRKIGSVNDVILNKNGKIDAVVIDVGSFLGMGGKNVAVLPSDIKTDNNRLTLDRTKEQLQQMAEYRLEDRNTGAGTSTTPVEGGRLGTGSTTGR